jgi:hypothetical protein
LRGHADTVKQLVDAYKQINAPTGTLGIKTLTGISTEALVGDDVTYAALEAKIVSTANQRNAIAGKMINMLEKASFEDAPIDELEAKTLIRQATALLESIE